MRQFIKTLGMLSLVVSLAFVFSTSTSATAADTIKLGLIYALTGPGSALGTKQMDAAKLAVKEINDQGGANFGGKRVKIDALYQDTETKPDAAIRKMKAMIRDNKITALVGGTFAHVSMALNDQSKRTPVLFCCTNGVPETFFEKKNKGPYSCSTMANVTWIGRGAAAYVTEVMNLKNIVACMPDYAYGHGALKGMEEVFKKDPDVKYTTIMTPVGTADMTAYLIKAREAKPDVIMMGQWGNDAINILKQAYDMGLQKQTKLFFNWIVDVFATGIPPESLKGVTCQMFWYHDMTGFSDPEVVEASNAVNSRYMAAYGEPMDPYVMSAYYGVKEMIRAMEVAKSTDPKKAYAALMSSPDWVSGKGPAKWRVDGQVNYKNASFIGIGLGPEERKNPKWDYVKIIDSYKGDSFQKPPSDLGW